MKAEIISRYAAFWAHSKVDRAVLHLSVHDGAAYAPPKDEDEHWTCLDYRIGEAEHSLRHTQYFAEGYAGTWLNLGPGTLAAMMGADYHFTPNTVWFGEKPLITDWAYAKNLRLQAGGMTAIVDRLTQGYCDFGKGKMLIGITDLGGTLDVLASFRGTQDLLMDLYDYPEAVLDAIDRIDDVWEEAFTQSHRVLARHNHNGAMSAWIPIYCEKRWFPLQCDFSAMISPEQFERFVMPSLVRGANFLDHSIYHLDGRGELPHLDQLLSISRLDGIQWVPGDGAPGHESDCWFPYYERIQAAGKNLVLTGVSSAENCIKLLKNLKHDGLFINAELASAEEAEAVIAAAEKYAR